MPTIRDGLGTAVTITAGDGSVYGAGPLAAGAGASTSTAAP